MNSWRVVVALAALGGLLGCEGGTHTSVSLDAGGLDPQTDVARRSDTGTSDAGTSDAGTSDAQTGGTPSPSVDATLALEAGSGGDMGNSSAGDAAGGNAADLGAGDGCIDRDGDGSWVGSGQPEMCNGRDDDCDGAVDEALADEGLPCATGLPGRCAPGFATCVLGVPACAPSPGAEPRDETCNAEDDDCDGQVDEALFQVCGLATGECRLGQSRCVAGVYGACEGQVEPRDEVCNGLDDDCDTLIDDVLPLGTAAFTDPAWAALDVGVVLAETADGSRQAVIFHAPGVNGAMVLKASIVDLGRRRIIATFTVFETRSTLQPQAIFVGDDLWIAFIDQPGSNGAQLQVARFGADGRALGAPVVLGGDVDAFRAVAGPERVGIIRLEARDQLRFSMHDPSTGAVVDQPLPRPGVELDTALMLAPRATGWLVGFGQDIGPIGSDSRLSFSLLDANGVEEQLVETALVNARRPAMVSTPGGHRLVYAFRYYEAPAHVAIESRSVSADGALGEPRPLVAFPGDPMAATPEPLAVTSHGNSGLLVTEWLRNAAREWGLYLTRADPTGNPWVLRVPARVDGVPVQSFSAGGTGVEILHAWIRPDEGHVSLSRSPLGGCPPRP